MRYPKATREEAAQILHQVADLLPNPSGTLRGYIHGQADGLVYPVNPRTESNYVPRNHAIEGTHTEDGLSSD